MDTMSTILKVEFRDEIARTKDAASGLWKLALDPGGE
jgi:hypothetical protein